MHGRPVKRDSHTHTGSAAPALTPALCEDGTPPVRTQGAYACQDGSEPSCEDASEPLAGAGGGPPECQAPAPAGGEEGESQDPESSCEVSLSAGEAAPACEASGGGEALS